MPIATHWPLSYSYHPRNDLGYAYSFNETMGRRSYFYLIFPLTISFIFTAKSIGSGIANFAYTSCISDDTLFVTKALCVAGDS